MSSTTFFTLSSPLTVLFLPPIEPHSVELKGVVPGLVGVSERSTGESNVGQLTRPRAFSQSAMHSLERGDRGNTQALAELAQVIEEHNSKTYKSDFVIHNFAYCKRKLETIAAGHVNTVVLFIYFF